jgi:hypothetical protein
LTPKPLHCLHVRPISDGLLWDWSIWNKHFSAFEPILDFMHAELLPALGSGVLVRVLSPYSPCLLRNGHSRAAEFAELQLLSAV